MIKVDLLFPHFVPMLYLASYFKKYCSNIHKILSYKSADERFIPIPRTKVSVATLFKDVLEESAVATLPAEAFSIALYLPVPIGGSDILRRYSLTIRLSPSISHCGVCK
jgi:hypothetical protein